MPAEKILDYKLFYRRNLPHYQPEHAIIFITYRLNVPLPDELKQLINRKHKDFFKRTPKSKEDLKRKRLDFEKIKFDIIDNYLGLCKAGPQWLADARIANIVIDSLFLMNGDRYILFCFCIMPNHVHTLFKPLPKNSEQFYSLAEIMKSHKGVTSNQANKILNRSGTFWHDESYDHVVRDEKEFYRIAWYIAHNPVRANLVKNYNDWHYTWIEENLRGYLGL